MPPKLEIVKQLPCISAAFSFPSLAFALISINSAEISMMPFLSTSRTTGTTSPFGVSTAIPIWIYFFITKASPDSDNDELNVGNAFNASATAFIINTSGVILIPSLRLAAISFCSFLNASSSVISASSN